MAALQQQERDSQQAEEATRVLGMREAQDSLKGQGEAQEQQQQQQRQLKEERHEQECVAKQRRQQRQRQQAVRLEAARQAAAHKVEEL